jgi:two-component system, cell cycle response regulator
MSHELAAENKRLREQLAQLLDHAHKNQQILQRHQALDLQLISADGFLTLINTVFHSFAETAGLDVVTLALLDGEYDIRRILVDLGIKLSEQPQVLFLQEEAELGELCQTLPNPVLGPYSEQLHGAMFPEPLSPPASVAVVPLIRRGHMIGCMSLGSREAGRFAPHMATDFLEHMASIIAICIENVINNERLKHIGVTDPLTGVNNRRYIERRLLEEVGRARRQRGSLSCLYIDIDHFKQINDSVGHQAGDEVLRGVAERIKAELRVSDAFGRFGGEEFVVLLPETDSGDAANVAERIRQGIAEQPLMLDGGKDLRVTVSIGVASLVHPQHHEPVESAMRHLVACADQALYQAKAGGRNLVMVGAG